MENITERDSGYRHLEKMSVLEVLQNINREDQKVALSVQVLIPKIVPLVEVIAQKMEAGGRLFYIGAGTSGRYTQYRSINRCSDAALPGC